MEEDIVYRPIGVIHSPFSAAVGTPIQSAAARGVAGTIEVFDRYAEGLKDLDGFSHIWLLYHFHLANSFVLTVKPFLDSTEHGLFATRAPARPNGIGLSVVRLTGIRGHVLSIEDVDIIDGTPLLDIKPYVPLFDARDAERTGWLQGRSGEDLKMRDDGRFAR
jgi:tRNA (adenine37-N6)-methyltransferase